MKNNFRLKAYTLHGLITSRWMDTDNDIKEALLELSQVTEIKTVYKTNGKTSSLIKFTIQKPPTRPIYYTRSDGLKVHSLSIHPSNYPMQAHYADGRIELLTI
jgi:hypothetical protein